ncbi:hypothetical protein [Streptomyces sp. NPDC059460]|uniref:hypothetical protein n=1 Tax=Streptomyces sp. NPDC059460 TaxID=3346840 RepID=UPI003682C5D4
MERLRTWLDEHAEQVSDSDVRLLRVLKIGEEFDEVAEALHGAMGANLARGRPTRGTTLIRNCAM